MIFPSITGKEEEAISIQDNRKLLVEGVNEMQPNNKLLIICDHASNDSKYSALEKHEEELMRSSDAYDIGAADFASELSERLKCINAQANFSKILIDPAKPLTSREIVPEYFRALDEEGERIPISFNHQGYRYFDRL